MAAGKEINGTISIKTISILKSPKVHMKNESDVFQKINKIVSQGSSKLQFMTDFDQTITKQHEKGKTSLMSIDILFKYEHMPESTKDAIEVVHKKYEEALNPVVPIEKRIEVINELFETVHQKLQGIEFDRREIENLVRKYGPSFRDGTQELFSILQNLNIPVVVFSGGLSEVIIEHFKQENIPYDDINIIANHLKFNGTVLEGLQNHENVVTSFNKHEHLTQNTDPEIFDTRKNIILMGDNTGDTTMVREYEDKGTILKIGFFYNQPAKALEIFKETFDIVLYDDQTMEVILEIIKLLQ